MTPLKQMCASIADLGACQEAQDWMEELPSDWTPQQAWDACEHPDWMLWLLGRSKQPNTGKLVSAACRIARTVLHLVPADEERPRLAIEAAEEWVKNPSPDTAHAAARAAADAAYAAADAAYAAAHAAARAAADAAYAAADAAYAAAHAARAARAAAHAAAYAAAHAARAAAHAAYAAADAAACRIIREFFPNPPELG